MTHMAYVTSSARSLGIRAGRRAGRKDPTAPLKASEAPGVGENFYGMFYNFSLEPIKPIN